VHFKYPTFKDRSLKRLSVSDQWHVWQNVYASFAPSCPRADLPAYSQKGHLHVKAYREADRPISAHMSTFATRSCKSITIEVLRDSPPGHTGERCAGAAHLITFPVKK
jgi:hypothetical protein